MNRSCETQLLSTVNYVAESLDAGRQFDLMLLDFSKAFDRVAYMRLCHKLCHLALNGSVLVWIKYFLLERTQRVVNGGKVHFLQFLLAYPRKWCWAPFYFYVT